MSSKFIPGLGFVAVSSSKTPEEIDATFEYYENIAPKYDELGGFQQGFDDVHSIAYEAWKQINRTDDENKNAWMEREVEEWGGLVGFTDSIALEEYFKKIESLRELTPVEKSDRESNVLSMENFKADMYNAYDNEDGDISDVQKKYGYDEEELGVLSGLAAMGKMLFTDTGYMAGQITGMVAKDPEMLLLGLFRIPAMAGQLTARATQMATMAMKVQPKYVQGLSKAIQGNRGRAVIGRGVEGAVYGGVYEALHDLTFKGHIDADNLERGVALGTLLGSAFGGITKNVGKQSWLLNKMTSENAAKHIQQLKYSLQDPNLKWQKADTPLGAGTPKNPSKGKSVLSFEKGWQEKLAEIKAQNKGYVFNKDTQRYEPPKEEGSTPKTDATGETIDPNADNFNPDFARKIPKKAVLPKGLDNLTKATYWQERVKQLVREELDNFDSPYGRMMDEYTSVGTKSGVILSSDQAARQIQNIASKDILWRQKKLLLEKNKDGSQKYTKDEAGAIAAKEEARRLEKRNPDFIKKEGLAKNSPYKKNWGSNRERELGETLEGAGTVVKTAKDFSHIFKETFKELPKPTAKQYAMAGGIGGAIGLGIADEDKTLGGLLGLTGGLLVRRITPSINVSQAKVRMRMYKVVNESEGVSKTLQMQAGKTVAVLHQVLKGKNQKVSSLEFLNYLENFSKSSKVIDGIDYGRKGRNKLDPEVQNAIEAYRDLMKDFEIVAKKVGVFGDRQFVKDYVTHIFKHKNLADGDISNFIKALNKKGSNLDNTSTYSNPRKLLKNIEELHKSGKYPNIETDVFKILDAYTRSMSKAIAGKNITNQLEMTGMADGMNTFSMIITPKEMNRTVKVADVGEMTLQEYAVNKLGYQTSNHPALKGKLIHPLMKKSIDDFYAPEIGSEGLVNKLLLVNNALKRVAVSFSFFHAQSLVFSGIYAGMLTEGMSAVLNVTPRGKAARQRFNLVRRVAKGEFESFGRDKNGKPLTQQNIHGREAHGEVVGANLLKEMAEEGVGLGLKASEYVDAGYNTVKGLMEKYAPPLDKAQTFIDKWTWDKTHDIGKMFVYLTVKDRMMQAKPRGIGKIMPVLSKIRGKDLGEWKPMNHAEAKQAAAAYTNDAFGGQSHSKLAMEWQQKAIDNANNPKGFLYNMIALWTTPSSAKLSNLFLFSPDWTISNLRIGFRGLGMTKDLLGKIQKGQKLTAREMAEWNNYMGYMTRGVVATSAVAYLMHEWLNDSGEEFDLQNFWLTGRLPLGTGEEMVVSKQIAEPMHWLMHPGQTFMNKMSSLPKIGGEILLGKQYISMKNGVLIGPQLDRGNPKELMWWMLGKGTPISLSKAKSALQDDEDNYTVGDVVTQTMFGSVGFPVYGRKY